MDGVNNIPNRYLKRVDNNNNNNNNNINTCDNNAGNNNNKSKLKRFAEKNENIYIPVRF